MSVDYRREWIKEKITKYLGLPDGTYFDDMLAANDGELEEKLDMFLDDDIMLPDESHKKFYFYRTTYEKLVDEEILVAEIGTYCCATLYGLFVIA